MFSAVLNAHVACADDSFKFFIFRCKVLSKSELLIFSISDCLIAHNQSFLNNNQSLLTVNESVSTDWKARILVVLFPVLRLYMFAPVGTMWMARTVPVFSWHSEKIWEVIVSRCYVYSAGSYCASIMPTLGILTRNTGKI